jgi:predicted TIM-barrel fold metal-dependent hydrolase
MGDTRGLKGRDEPIGVDRRHFVRGLSALSAWIVSHSSATRFALAAAPSGALVIDAHCHPFNGADVPIYGFLQKVVIEQQLADFPPLQNLAEAFAYFLATFIAGNAPGYKKERDMLVGLIKNPKEVAALKRNPVDPADDQEFFSKGLNNFIEQHTSFAGTQGLSQQNDELIANLIRRYGPIGFREKTKKEIGSSLSNPDERKAIVDETVKTILQKRVKSKADLPSIDEIDAYIAQFFSWVREFTQYRFQIMKDLVDITGDSADKSRMWVPTLLDVEFWLRWPSEPGRLTTLSEQADLVQLMSQVKLPAGRIIPGFIGFDPWRYMHDKHFYPDKDPLEVVKHAIEHQGFVGVKIYPPMGFKPWNNADGELKAKDFPQALQDLQFEINGTSNPGQSLDDALGQLYSYCHHNDVAILTHCSNSIGSHVGYAERAAPKNWEVVLKKYPDLRLCLGHWGGIWDQCSENGCTNDDQAWPGQILTLLKATKADGVTPAYKNLYVDVGDFSGVMMRWRDETKKAQETCKYLKPLLSNNAILKSRILYGSDWMLLGREPANASYFADMRTYFEDILTDPSDQEAFLGGNAKNFLGLREGAKSRGRLDAFFRRTNQEPLNLG